MLSYTEYIMVIINNGIKEKNFDLHEIWTAILLNDRNDEKIRECWKKSFKLFVETQKKLKLLQNEINEDNKSKRMPYQACCVDLLQSSPCL